MNSRENRRVATFNVELVEAPPPEVIEPDEALSPEGQTPISATSLLDQRAWLLGQKWQSVIMDLLRRSLDPDRRQSRRSIRHQRLESVDLRRQIAIRTKADIGWVSSSDRPTYFAVGFGISRRRFIPA
jgi:hypothetical protein